jgi:hypothetical protein
MEAEPRPAVDVTPIPAFSKVRSTAFLSAPLDAVD